MIAPQMKPRNQGGPRGVRWSPSPGNGGTTPGSGTCWLHIDMGVHRSTVLCGPARCHFGCQRRVVRRRSSLFAGARLAANDFV